MNDASLSHARRAALRSALPQVADLLHHRRAGEIDEVMIDDLVALSWLEWIGGTLQLTHTGTNICRQHPRL